MYEDYFVPFPVIETERLVLRMVKRSDAKQLFDHCSLKETSQFSLWSPHKTLRDTKDFIAYQHSLYKKKQCYFFVVEDKLSKEVIGTCSYVSMDDDYKIAEKDIQKLTDDFTKKVDDVIGKKEKELMAV